MSFFVPGLGQMYNGQAKKGMIFFFTNGFFIFPVFLIMCFTFLGLPKPLNVLLPLCMTLYIHIDAIIYAVKMKYAYRKRSYDKWYIYFMIVICNILCALTVRYFAFQAWHIAYGSMEDALLPGDFMLFNKTHLSSSASLRGAVVIFKYPWDDEHDWIARVIALPGERVEVDSQQVYVNGQPLREPYARYTAPPSPAETFGPVVVPKRGDVVEIRRDKRLYLNGAPIPIPSGSYDPPLRRPGAAMTGLEVFYGPLVPPGTTLQRPLEPRVVQHDYYFTLVDNRDKFADSRHWGFVRHERLQGTAGVIYWSWDRHAKRVRWNRIGMRVKVEKGELLLPGTGRRSSSALSTVRPRAIAARGAYATWPESPAAARHMLT